MAMRLPIVCGVLLLVTALSLHNARVHAADPDIVTDFLVPAGMNASSLDGSFFTSTTLRQVKLVEGTAATVTPVNSKVFPALDGLGVSFAMLQYPPLTLNALHTHPRGSELLYIVQGVLDVGLIDSTNKLFTQTLHEGDLFVFPKGLVHFQINSDKKQTVKAVAGFSSSNPGLIRLPANLFKSGISDTVLQKSFGVTADTIKTLKGY
ncbi:hypothetical protein Mapa_018685 [Marchantia paleacea]|nr:hypothetical protein Mapa_018685 [Marchantia paleacea]